jgi:lambda repressor-like predicted transcriptional regulator
MGGGFARDRVRAAMTAEGWSYRQLARRAGLAPSTLSRLLRDGGTALPHGDTVVALERALSLPRGTLLGMELAPQQIALWPGIVNPEGGTPEGLVLRALRSLAGDTRLEAARAAVATIIDLAVQSKTVDPELHQCLAALDALRAQRKGGQRRAPRTAGRTVAGARAASRVTMGPDDAKTVAPLPAAG